MKVQITAEHIRKGIRHDVTKCALALGIQDAVGGEVEVVVTAFEARVRDQEGFYRAFALSFDVLQFRRNFDAGIKVQPIEFEI